LGGVSKPRLLDLFCGAGGAAMGYARAGFEVVGVDIRPQPHYPFEFHQADALEFMSSNSARGFDAIHASPPCQRWADGFVRNRDKHPDLIEPTRRVLRATGLPYVIENVKRAPLLDAITICGGGLACISGELQLHRHRRFESNVALFGVQCTRWRRLTVSVVGNGTPSGNRKTIGYNPSIAQKREAMGIEWMSRAELSEAIPPAYTEWIGRQLLAVLEKAA
jgi:DNA (cytosine-5)-methyltransferase 1